MSKVRYDTTAKDEWDSRTGNLVASQDFVPFFHDELKNILPKSDLLSCIELGALPGGFLTYFHKKFGYKVTGLDFADNTEVFDETMKSNGIKKYDFIKADILKYKPKTDYDVVSSFGFIEHFDDIDQILSQHIDLMKPGAYLVLTVPNFRNIQYVYHRIFDAKNLSIHNTETMKIKDMDKRLTHLGLEKIKAKYVGTTEFWFEDEWRSRLAKEFRTKITNNMTRLFRRYKPSAAYSPLILYVYRKPSEV